MIVDSTYAEGRGTDYRATVEWDMQVGRDTSSGQTEANKVVVEVVTGIRPFAFVEYVWRLIVQVVSSV